MAGDGAARWIGRACGAAMRGDGADGRGGAAIRGVGAGRAAAGGGEGRAAGAARAAGAGRAAGAAFFGSGAGCAWACWAHVGVSSATAKKQATARRDLDMTTTLDANGP